MKILNASRELSKREEYKLTAGKGVQKIQDSTGLVIDVDIWAEYEDVNAKGETVKVLSIMDKDGSIYTTVSETFKRSFYQIVEKWAGEDLPGILVLEGSTKNGRTYYDCTIE